MALRKYIFLGLTLGFIFVRAQDSYRESNSSDSAYQYIYSQTSAVDSVIAQAYTTDNTSYPRKFKNRFREKYTSNDFNYAPSQPKKNGWDGLLGWLISLLNYLAGSWLGLLLKFLGVLLGGYLVYVLVKFLISKDYRLVSRRKVKQTIIKEEDIIENIQIINFIENIKIAEKRKDFRAAIRYYFWYVLKKLADRKYLVWNTEKTNHDYLKELKSETMNKTFANLLYIYEYIWYGEFGLDETQYKMFKKKFEDFNEKL